MVEKDTERARTQRQLSGAARVESQRTGRRSKSITKLVVDGKELDFEMTLILLLNGFNFLVVWIY